MADWDVLPGDLKIPFIFVPYGDPEPTEWMAAHPGWVKFPATFVPRPPASSELSEPIAASATAAAAGSGSVAELVPEALGALARIGGALAEVAGPLAFLAPVLFPSYTAPRDLDEVQPGREGFDAGRSLAPLPGLAPPATRFRRPGEGGFPPTPALPRNPGFGPAPTLPHGSPGRLIEDQRPAILHQDQGAATPPGANSRSQRARENARKADPEVTQALPEADWRAHHLINLAGLQVAPNLVAAARRAGWHVDDVGNVAALPGSQEAQQTLKTAGIDRPVHDSGHAKWNADVRSKLLQIRTDLGNRRLRSGSEAYDRAARQELERLQNELRQDMLDRSRLTQIEPDEGPVAV